MTSHEPRPLSPDDFPGIRIQSLGIEALRQVYVAEIATGKAGPESDAFLELVEAGREMPYEDVAATDRSSRELVSKLQSDIERRRAAGTSGGRTNSFALRRLREDLKSARALERDLGQIFAEIKPWPIPSLVTNDEPKNQLEKTGHQTTTPEKRGDMQPAAEHLEDESGISSLFPLLVRAHSEHATVYKRRDSVAVVLQERRTLPFQSAERQKTDLVAQRVKLLEQLFLADPEDTTYLEYYTPTEIIALTDKLLEAYSRRDDPAYLAEIMQRAKPIADKTSAYAERTDDYHFALDEALADTSDAHYLMSEERERVPEQVWDTHEDETERMEQIYGTTRGASEKIRRYMLAGRNRNVHRRNYLITVINPDDLAAMNDNHLDEGWPSHRDLYQFICDEHAMDTLGTLRQSESTSALREACRTNVETILKWATDNEAAIAGLPADFFLAEKTKMNKSRHTRALEKMPARQALRFQIRMMQARLKSSEVNGPLRSFDSSPSSFYDLQLGIAKMVEEIKEQLPHYEDDSMSTVLIEPL
jgi:hypothetical protein